MVIIVSIGMKGDSLSSQCLGLNLTSSLMLNANIWINPDMLLLISFLFILIDFVF